MNAKNSDLFLTAFNRIDQRLKEIVMAKGYLSFSRLIDKAKKTNSIVRKYEDELRSYANLRNAIVHHQIDLDFVIAEPHITTVHKIEEIELELSRPLHVGRAFRKRVLTFQMNDSLSDALKLIRNRQYTQFPVYEGIQFKGLLTTVGITNWLARRMQQGSLTDSMPFIGDLLFCEKRRDNYKFISRYMPTYEAEEIFKEGVEKGQRYEALLITEHGKTNQKLIGMITPLDIMKVK